LAWGYGRRPFYCGSGDRATVQDLARCYHGVLAPYMVRPELPVLGPVLRIPRFGASFLEEVTKKPGRALGRKPGLRQRQALIQQPMKELWDGVANLGCRQLIQPAIGSGVPAIGFGGLLLTGRSCNPSRELSPRKLPPRQSRGSKPQFHTWPATRARTTRHFPCADYSAPSVQCFLSLSISAISLLREVTSPKPVPAFF
jgi:hypothetical protein